MKVRDFVKFLMDFNMDAEIVVSNGSTYDEHEEMDITWGGPNYGDGAGRKDAEFIYINNMICNISEV